MHTFDFIQLQPACLHSRKSQHCHSTELTVHPWPVSSSLYQLLLVLFIWKDPLHCVRAIQLLLVHTVGLRQVLLHDFVVLLLVHGASLRPFHWFLCFYWCMALAWAATVSSSLPTVVHLSELVLFNWKDLLDLDYWSLCVLSFATGAHCWTEVSSLCLLVYTSIQLSFTLTIQLSFTLTMQSVSSHSQFVYTSN